MRLIPGCDKPAGLKKLSLAEETWQEFSRFLSRYQWAFDEPRNSPRAMEIASAIKNRGRKGACTFFRPEGYKYILPVLHPRHFQKAITCHSKIYYVSWGKQALLYLDIDLHHNWQTQADGQEAQRLLHDLLSRCFGKPVLFWNESSRGFNGYLKVDLWGMDYGKANEIFDRLEKAFQRFLALRKNLADFEIKGRVGFLADGAYTWKQYGKLPIHSPGWNFARLEEFRATPTVPLRCLEVLCERIEAAIPAEVLEQHKVYKQSLGGMPKVKGGYFLVTPAIENALVAKHGEGWRYMFSTVSEDQEGSVWLGLKYYRPGETPITEVELRQLAREAASPAPTPASMPAPVIASAKPAAPPVKVNLTLDDLASEPDSFERQREALLQLSRYLKRVPDVDEGLAFIREKSLFTSSWEQHMARRRARVRSILRFIARSFDAGKCANGTVNVSKYDAWAAKMFPNGLVGRGGSSLTEDGEIVAGQVINVSPSFIAVFMAVAEFTLVTNKNQDGTLPHRRAEALWAELYARGLVPVKFCARKWAACREELVKYGIIQITNRDYSPGKAMEWDVGVYFPGLGLWKRQKKSSLLDPGGLSRRKTTTQQEHNTLLRSQSKIEKVLVGSARSRPPPCG